MRSPNSIVALRTGGRSGRRRARAGAARGAGAPSACSASAHGRRWRPSFAASPYLASLAARIGAGARRTLLGAEPTAALPRHGWRRSPGDGGASCAILKAELHLLTALADLGGVWDLDEVTGALTRFADARRARRLRDRRARAAGRRPPVRGPATTRVGSVPGLFCIAMGKHGAFELNYSSDIDISVFYDPDALPLAPGVEPQAFAVRLTDRVADMLQARTADGYVFRVDLRLRPDPSSTPVAVSLPAAFDYYESVGQNWERAAFIKARRWPATSPLGEASWHELQPFIWRRNLDFAAIADIHSIKRQIHAHKVDERLTAAGADLKLGRGGIREIEFYVQTQQLILGGRHPALRAPRHAGRAGTPWPTPAMSAPRGRRDARPPPTADCARSSTACR